MAYGPPSQLPEKCDQTQRIFNQRTEIEKVFDDILGLVALYPHTRKPSGLL